MCRSGVRCCLRGGWALTGLAGLERRPAGSQRTRLRSATCTARASRRTPRARLPRAAGCCRPGSCWRSRCLAHAPLPILRAITPRLLRRALFAGTASALVTVARCMPTGVAPSGPDPRRRRPAAPRPSGRRRVAEPGATRARRRTRRRHPVGHRRTIVAHRRHGCRDRSGLRAMGRRQPRCHRQRSQPHLPHATTRSAAREGPHMKTATALLVPSLQPAFGRPVEPAPGQIPLPFPGMSSRPAGARRARRRATDAPTRGPVHAGARRGAVRRASRPPDGGVDGPRRLRTADEPLDRARTGAAARTIRSRCPHRLGPRRDGARGGGRDRRTHGAPGSLARPRRTPGAPDDTPRRPGVARTALTWA